MKKMRLDVRGIGTAGLLIIIVAVVAIAGIGWLLMHNGKTSGGAGASDGGGAVPAYSSADNYVNVIQHDDKSVMQQTPGDIAKTADEAKILQAIHDSCAGRVGTDVTVNAAVFQKQETYRDQNGFAFISASACDPVLKTASGTLKSVYLHKDKTSGSWIVDDVTASGASCDKVTGKGYPFEIVQTCVTADGKIQSLQ